jgi:hypothetical protein
VYVPAATQISSPKAAAEAAAEMVRLADAQERPSAELFPDGDTYKTAQDAGS